MYQARYRIPGTSLWIPIAASDYDAAVHGTDLRCGDPFCDAVVAFHKCDVTHASIAALNSHFHSIDRKSHRPQCTALGAVHDGRHNSMPVPQALAEGKPVIISVNFPTGHPLYKSLSNGAAAENFPSAYNDFRRERPHGTRSVKTLKDFFQVVARIHKAGPAALHLAQVAHCFDIRPLREVLMGSEEEKLRNLYNDMAARKPDLNGIITDFPRLLHFSPTGKEYHARAKDWLTGNRVIVNGYGQKGIILLNVLDPVPAELRRQILEAGGGAVMATPRLRKQDVLEASEDFRNGRKTFVEMRWRIVSNEQVGPVTAQFQTVMKAFPGTFMGQLGLDFDSVPALQMTA
jgi:hypothetical protein